VALRNANQYEAKCPILTCSISIMVEQRRILRRAIKVLQDTPDAGPFISRELCVMFLPMPWWKHMRNAGLMEVRLRISSERPAEILPASFHNMKNANTSNAETSRFCAGGLAFRPHRPSAG
jgi:hypothetical protein